MMKPRKLSTAPADYPSSLRTPWFRLPLLSLMAICFSVCVSAQTPIPSRTSEKQCGPPDYCARTDRKVEPYGAKPPVLGRAGSIITDPNFGSRILRVTDEKTDPRREGGPIMTPSSAEQNTWNTNSTKFYVVGMGGKDFLYDFDPSTMTAKSKGLLDVAWGGEPQFSYTQPNVLYGIDHRNPSFQQIDVSNGRLTTLDNISDCVKLNSDDGGHGVTVSADDNRFMTNVGPRQDGNYLVYIYDRQLGCRWYNTQTGEIGGKWGPKGTVTMPDRLLIHNARMSKSGKFVYIARGQAQPHHHWVVWEVDTMTVTLCPSDCTGHRAVGYSHLVGPSGAINPMDLQIRPLNHLEETSSLVPDLQRTNGYWYDLHFSWNNVNAEDTIPICFSTYRPGNPNIPGSPLAVDGPWENEIDCVETDGKGHKVWRFAHNYSTAKNGFWSTPRGNVSQDGRFFMFTSDWQDQLGEIRDGKKFRTDVFIVELK
jgi:hypothetical protein